MLFSLCPLFKLQGVAKAISHVIKLVMAVGTCFYYPVDWNKIALFCDKNNTLAIHVSHSFPITRQGFPALSNALSSSRDYEAQREGGWSEG